MQISLNRSGPACRRSRPEPSLCKPVTTTPSGPALRRPCRWCAWGLVVVVSGFTVGGAFRGPSTVVDNYMIHHRKKTWSAVEALAGKVVLHYLPPYSPEGNLIERVWLNMHNNVTRNHRHTDIESVVDSSLNYLDNYDGRGARAVADLRMAA